MCDVLLVNELHGTRTMIRADRGGQVSRKLAKRTWKKLCGDQNCLECGILGENPRLSYMDRDGRILLFLEVEEGAKN